MKKIVLILSFTELVKVPYFTRNFWVSFIVAASWLGHAASLRATAIYDSSLRVTVDFNVPWVSVQKITTRTHTQTSTTGEATAHAFFEESADLLNYTYTQAAHVTGSAGDTALLDSGTSFATASLYNLFTFDFGATPTDFTITLLAAGFFPASQSTDAPVLNGHITSNGTGETANYGGGGYQINGEDGVGVNIPGESVTIPDLTGIHTFHIFTVAGTASATAVYPYTVTVPEGCSTFVLLLVSLISGGIFRQFRHSC